MKTAVAANQDVEKLSHMYQITRQEAGVQKAIYDLWYKHYTNDKVTTKYRNDMARVFNALWADTTEIKVDKAFLRHPATRLKDFARSYTISEILADFIMCIDQVAERSEEYSINGVDKVFRDTVKDRGRLAGIYSQDEEDMDAMIDGEQLRKTGLPRLTDSPMSKYDLSEYSVVEKQSKVGEPINDGEVESDEVAIRKFQRILVKEKSRAVGYARLYANDGYDFKDALSRIRKLDISRVRTCTECGNVFYAHDRRRHLCDLQHGIVKDKFTGIWRRSELSHCEVENAKVRSVKQRESA